MEQIAKKLGNSQNEAKLVLPKALHKFQARYHMQQVAWAISIEIIHAVVGYGSYGIYN